MLWPCTRVVRVNPYERPSYATTVQPSGTRSTIARKLAVATMRNIRQNLFFAFIYNILGIPAAAFGLLNPVIAGAAMALSSVSVVSNSLLLRRWRPGKSD